jgi:hypothetical protein
VAKYFLAFHTLVYDFWWSPTNLQRKIGYKLPYYHILPRGSYTFLLKQMGEKEAEIQCLLEVWDTSITID